MRRKGGEELLTKELVARLQHLDPSGEIHVSVLNADVIMVERVPATEGGCQQRLTLTPGDATYQPSSVTLASLGDKVRLVPYCLEDVLEDYPATPVFHD